MEFDRPKRMLNLKRRTALAVVAGTLAGILLAGTTSSAVRNQLKSALVRGGGAGIGSNAQRRQKGSASQSLEEGRRVLLAAARAAGGRRLLAVKSLGMDESGVSLGPKGKVSLAVKWTVAYPDRSRGDVLYGGQSVIQTCDDKSAWIVVGSRARDATPTIGEFERGIALFGGGWGLYREVLAGQIEGRATGQSEIDGKKANGVAVHGPFGDVALFFDPTTHLLVAARFETATPQGKREAEQRWSGYRPVGGRQFAFSTATFRGGEKLFESKVSAVKINPPVQDSLFAKPEPAPAKVERRAAIS
jgi:hypothetical protein